MELCKPTTVTVVIPTYNRHSLLARALRSLMAQTRPPDEIIVVDDGSTDGTGERLAREFPSVRYFAQERRGVSSARNRAIRAASGEWMGFLDSDDEWLPEKLARQLAVLAAQPDHHVCHTNEFWIRRGRKVNPRRVHAKRGGRIFQHCLPLCVISPSSALIHRSVLKRVGLFDEGLIACEDYDLWLRVCAIYPVLYLEEPLVVKHGGHSDQLSAAHWGMDRFRMRALTKIIESHELGAEERNAAIETLLRKIDIYLPGARKRGKLDEVDTLHRVRKQYEERLDNSRTA